MRQANLVSFGEAVAALKQGKRIAREGWNGAGLFVFMQIDSQIPLEIVPKMQSLPQTVKNEFSRRLYKELRMGEEALKAVDPILFNDIRYRNQLALVYPDNTIYGYVPSTSDCLADDWTILDEESPEAEHFAEQLFGSTFGEAVGALKQGKKVSRNGWNGKGMYLYLVAGQSFKSLTKHAQDEFGDQTPYRQYLALKTAQNDVATWGPSNSDVLSNDWQIHE